MVFVDTVEISRDFFVQMGEIQEKSCHIPTSFRRLGNFFGRQISGALLNDM